MSKDLKETFPGDPLAQQIAEYNNLVFDALFGAIHVDEVEHDLCLAAGECTCGLPEDNDETA